jgi:hypothetical protein
MYYFEGCGRPFERSLCKICGSEIGAAAYDQLLVRNNGKGEQIKMPIPEGIKHIDNEIQRFEEKEIKGYLFNPVNENAKIDSKQNIKPITFRTLHFILHTLIFSFAEFGFIDKMLKINNENSHEYFKAHFFQDYKMIGELLGTQETHIWIYQLLAAFEGVVREKTPINTAVALNKLEKSFEDQVIFPVIQSVNTVIQKYKQAYVEYHKLIDEEEEEEEDIGIFVEELQLDQAKYPWLEFFNYMKFPDFTDFSNQFALLIGDAKNFSLLDFVLKRHEELANITSLPTIVDFTNNLMKKFNYQISRDKASTTLMSSLFEEDEELKKRFKNFENSWNRIQKVQTVRVGCQEKPYKKISDQDTLSLLLPNNNKDESGLIVLGTMIYLAILQNEFIYTAKRANNPNKSLEEIIAGEKTNMEIIQTVQTDQVIHINKNLVMTDIIQSGYIHNFEYGKGREVIYDFEEIEGRLHQYTNGKKIIDENKFITMNYQFELYPTGASIITDIRKKNPQENLSQEAKAKYRNTIKQIARDSKKDLLAYLGSLDYVFTYLRNIKENGDQTVEDFCKEKILNYQHLNDYVIRRQPLSTVCLKYIVDLYETLEEVIFDEAIQDYIRPEFLEQIPEEEKTKIIEMFDKVTLKNAIYPKLKEPDTLAKVFKRLILRILLAQVDINNRLLDYFAREDMWEQDVDINEIMDVELGEEVQLRHAYIILRHLEAQIVKLEPVVQVKQQNQLLNHQMEIEIENEKPKINQKAGAGGEKGHVEAKNKKNRRV